MKTVSSHSLGFDPAQLISEHQAGVWRYLRALGCDDAQAEDLTQDTFLSVLRKPFKQYNKAATAAYLRKVAFNLLVTAQRRAKRVTLVENVEEIDHTWACWAGDDDGEELLEKLRECLAGLTERARRALELRFRDREARAKIAAELEISEHGAKNLMQRAKKQLRTCIEGKMQ